MSDINSHSAPETQPELLLEPGMDGSLTIGLLANYADSDETRILLTPEACGIITQAGHKVVVETGVGIDINFTDDDYMKYGAVVAPRQEVLKLPVVLSFRPVMAEEVRMMTPGATLLCMLDNSLFDRKMVQAFLDRRITLGCLNNMVSHNEEPVFASTIDEIDGRASIMYAEEYISFLGGGKGVLLAGVAGINPCEVLIIGSGTKVNYAAMSAMAVGASVTLMDNDVSSLSLARQACGERLVTCAVQPKVLRNRLRTADVVILDHCTRDFELTPDMRKEMKENVYLLDLVESEPSQCVPRTVAMAMSNILVNFFDEMALKNGMEGMILTTPGVQEGIVTYNGMLVDKLIASYLGMHGMDLSLILAGGN